MSADPVEALFAVFVAGQFEWPQGGHVLFAGGCHHPALPAGAVIQNYIFSDDDRVQPELPAGPFAAILMHAPRQQEERHFMLAWALGALTQGGVLACAAANDAGGRRLAAEIAAFGLSQGGVIGKHKSQAVWAIKTGAGDQVLAARWLAAGAMQPLAGGRFISQPGIFGWNRVDRGSALLAASIKPGSLAGTGADFGCGYGYLAAHIVAQHDVKKIICADADYRAVEACRRNVAPQDGQAAEFMWCDLTRPPPALRGLDWVVMNPPFHEGRRTKPDIGGAFISSAAAALKTGGELWMVANNHLPYEAVLEVCFSSVTRIAQDQGFKVFHARK